MANDANVMALHELLTAHCRAEHGMACECIHSAAWLAAQGVLVPSALTEDEAGLLVGASELQPADAVRAEAVAYLERIAKGEGSSWPPPAAYVEASKRR